MTNIFCYFVIFLIIITCVVAMWGQSLFFKDSSESYSQNLESGMFGHWSNTANAVQDDMSECDMLYASNADDPSGLPEKCRRRFQQFPTNNNIIPAVD